MVQSPRSRATPCLVVLTWGMLLPGSNAKVLRHEQQLRGSIALWSYAFATR